MTEADYREQQMKNIFKDFNLKNKIANLRILKDDAIKMARNAHAHEVLKDSVYVVQE